MKLLLVVSKNVILVVCDRLSKIAHFMATIEETLAKGLVRLFRDNVQRQKNQLEQLATAKLVVNNKIYSATKVLLFIANYSRKLRIRADIRRKEKVQKVTKFIVRMKKI